MTTSNPAVGARPGTFFVDRPDGFVWWVTSQRAPSGVGFRWARFYGLRAADWDYATQEEAEAAGLVPLVSQAHVDDLKKAWQEHIESVRDQRDSLASDLSSANDEIARLADAAPAPLDPGNPEHLPDFDWKNAGHLRWLADAAQAAPLPISIGDDSAEVYEYVEDLAQHWNEEADRIEREAAKAEQDASDRKLAEQVAGPWALNKDYEAHVESVLAGIRAERERQEAGQ